MIWVDSSFAIEWLAGVARAQAIPIHGEALAILPNQYAETICWFARRDTDVAKVIEQLEALDLRHPERGHLQQAAHLYVEARQRKSKASLADAILAAVAQDTGGRVASFDGDFAMLGLVDKDGLWDAR